MELKRDTVLLINLIYRMLLLIGFLSEDEAPNFPVNNPILNWNYAVTDRVVLFLANGLREDFLEQDATPFLASVSSRLGAFAVADVDGILSSESALKLLLTGVPGHSSLFPWNRPDKYRTVLDFIACKCVIGRLPLERAPPCFHPGSTQVEVFNKFRMLVDFEENRECLYVVSFDFGGFTEGEYRRRLLNLDEDVRLVAEQVAEKWKDSRTTFLLTSSRGWSIWNRTDGSVSVPVIAWGEGILPRTLDTRLRLPDVSAMVSTLLGRSFPAGCLGKIPTIFFNVTPDAKFHMMLYNNEHLLKTMSNDVSDDDEFEVRNLKGFVEEEDAMTLQFSVETFLDRVDAVRLNRMKLASAMTILSFLLWGLIFIVVIVRGGLTLEISPWMGIFISVVGLITVAYTTQAVIQDVLLEILVPVTLHIYNDVIISFQREGFRAFFLAAISSIFITVVSLVGNLPCIIMLTTATLLWPALGGLVRVVNKKVLALWMVSGVALMSLPYYPVIGRTQSRGMIHLGTSLLVLLFQTVYFLFKRGRDFQTWVLIAVVFSSGCHVHLLASSWSRTSLSALLSWGFLSFFTVSACAVRGTLLEHLLKFHLALAIPLQMLSTRHECIFHAALTAQMLSWIFMENIPEERSVLAYNPSMFSLEKPGEYSSEKLQMKHYRQVMFFIVYCYVSFFAIGNVPSVYSYDLNILKPFGDLFSYFLIPLKFLIPYIAVTFSFLILSYTQRRDPAPLFILSLYFSDVISSCLLTYTYFTNDTFAFTAQHYVILQIVTISVTALYFVEKYLCLS